MKIGFMELLVIAVVAMVFIGPDKLPHYARKLGKMLNQVKEYTGAASKEIQENIVEPLEEVQKPLKEAMAPIMDIKKDIDDSVGSVTKSLTGIGKTSKSKAEKLAEQAEAEQAVDLTEEAPADLTAVEETAPAAEESAVETAPVEEEKPAEETVQA